LRPLRPLGPLHCNPSKSLILSKIFCACAKVVVCIFLPSIFLPFFSATFAPFRGYPEFGCGSAALCPFGPLRPSCPPQPWSSELNFFNHPPAHPQKIVSFSNFLVRWVRWVRWVFDNPQFPPDNAAMIVRRFGLSLRQFTPTHGSRYGSRAQKPLCLFGPSGFTACSTPEGVPGENIRPELHRQVPA